MEIKRKFVIKTIRIVNKTKVEYDYEYHSALKKYFSKKSTFFVEYDTDVSDVPNSILAIPLLANVLPISWFVGFDLVIDELDISFAAAQEQIKKEFHRIYPELKNKPSCLIINKLVRNLICGENIAQFFSGGLDSYTTYFRHFDENPDLITLIGADIPLEDLNQQKRVLQMNEEERILKRNERLIIKTNLRDFYTYHVNLLVPNLSWWGEVQHGMAIIGSAAPLAFIKKYKKIYIASTDSYSDQLPWGSKPYIDNNMKWADIEVIHDGFEMERIEKTNYLVKKCNEIDYRPKLRVCYSELNNGINCSKCEKCVRTAFGIMVSNDDPNKYGFNFTDNIFDKVIHILSGNIRETAWMWQLTLDKFKNNHAVFLFNMDQCDPRINKILNTNLQSALDSDERKNLFLKKIKFIIINNFSRLFDIYLKIRQKRL
jgi:hypothetical protein